MNGQKKLWKTSYPVPGNFLLVTAGPAEFGREAVDGKSVYFTLRNEGEGIWQQPLPDGTPRQVVDRLYLRNLFAPSKEGLYYIARSGFAFGLFMVGHTTGKTRQVTAFSNPLFWGLDLSPDERTLFYSQ